MKSDIFLPLRLQREYGKRRLSLFYPDLHLNDVNWAYRHLIDLYEECLKRNDAEAIQLLAETYDLDEIMKFDATYHVEKSLVQKYTVAQIARNRDRKVGQERNGRSRRYGSHKYQCMFKKLSDGNVIFSARTCVYSMAVDQMQQLFQLSDYDPKLRKDALVTDMFDAMLKHPDRDRLILFYLRYMVKPLFPIADLEDLENGTIKIVDHF